jgi:CubicO group peptidase (beta-lactamase class C family)
MSEARGGDTGGMAGVPAGGLRTGRRRLLAAVAAAPTLLLTPAVRAQPAGGGAVGHSLDDVLRPYLARYNLPAVAAAVVRNGAVVAAGATGTRRAGTAIPVSVHDRFHIGSDTKAMTALLAAMLVEEGRLRWDSTVAEIFPELAAGMNEGLRSVKLTQLLSHTSGIPSDNADFGRLVEQSFAQPGNLDELRYWLLKQWRTRPLQSTPGTRFAYSNLGYTIAGAMLERVAKMTWEELMVARIFAPMKLKTAGFGPQASLGRVDAPLGHHVLKDGKLKPMLAGPNGDNPEIIGPAGTVHLSILDFAAWAGWNAGEGRRGPALVRTETLRKLHTKVIAMPLNPNAPPGTPPQGGYALGWGIVQLPYSPQPFLTHAGSNGMNLASIMLQPDNDFALVLATNVGGTKAEAALKAAAEQLYRQFAGLR